jgi:hypothetical protein
VGHIPGSIITLNSGPLGIVAAGEDENSGALAVWRSTDGAAWERLEVEGDGRIFDFALDSAPLVAVGCTKCSSDGDPIQAAAWTSTDGSRWRLIRLHEQPAEVTAVRKWRGRFVAVGTSYGDLTGSNRCDVVSWRSDDGSTWGLAAPIDTRGCHPAMSATPDALVVLANATWSSSDGRKWSRIGPGLASDSVKSWEFARPGPGLIAFSQLCRYDPGLGTDTCRVAFSTSSDGANWTDAPDQPALQGWIARRVAVFADLVVAVGSGIDGPVVAESRDGLTWVRGGFDGHKDIVGLAVVGETIYAVTSSGDVWAGTRT